MGRRQKGRRPAQEKPDRYDACTVFRVYNLGIGARSLAVPPIEHEGSWEQCVERWAALTEHGDQSLAIVPVR
jgi:hypothetical protein